MKREWKPGDVALDPHHGVAVVVAPHVSGCPDYHRERGLHIHYGDGDWNPLVDRLRPLVVIDAEDREAVERLADVIAKSGVHRGRVARSAETNGLRAALREFANPKPPKPEEPTGLGAVVEDEDGRRYVRTADTDCRMPWSYANNYTDFEWSQVHAARVLSEGVQP